MQDIYFTKLPVIYLLSYNMWTDFEIDKLNKLTEKYKVITCVIGALNLYDFRIF